MADESVMLEAIIAARAVNMGAFAEVEAATKGMNVSIQNATFNLGSHTQAAKAATTAERDLVAEGNAVARAAGAAGVAGGEMAGRFTALASVMGSGGPLSIGIGAGIVGMGALALAMKSGIDNADSLEASLNNLDLAYQSQGQSVQTAGGWIDQFIQDNRRYIDNQYQARDAIAQVVRAGYDQATTQRIVDDAVDVSVAKHESFAQAVNDVQLGVQGNTRTLSTFGLTSTEVKKALEGTNNETERASIVLGLLEGHVSGARGGISNLTGSVDDLHGAWDDLSASFGEAANGPLGTIIEDMAKLIDDFDRGVTALNGFNNALIELASQTSWPLVLANILGGISPGQIGGGSASAAPGGASPQANHITVNVNGSSDPTTTGLVTAQTLHALMNA